MEISDRIFAVLKEKNITQKEFAEKTGIPIPTINDWKRKGNSPSAKKIMCICDFLEVTPQWLLEGSEGKTDYMIAQEKEENVLVGIVRNLSPNYRNRVLGYAQALFDLDKK